MKQQISLQNVIVLLIATVLPVLAVVLGCCLLFAGTLFNTAFAITHILIPLVSIALMTLIMFKVKRVFSKVILMIFVLIAFVVSFLFSSAFGTFEMLSHKKNTKIGEAYTKVCEAFDSMPTLKELGTYTQVEHYDYFSSTFGIFTCDADTLIVHYDSVEYQKQKALLDTTYVFQTEDMRAFEYTCEPFAEIHGYSFRVLAISEEYGWEIQYPKRMVFIATNDKDNSISYTAFYDDDLDYIVSLEEFLLKDCGWKHIIK